MTLEETQATPLILLSVLLTVLTESERETEKTATLLDPRKILAEVYYCNICVTLMRNLQTLIKPQLLLACVFFLVLYSKQILEQYQFR